MVTHIRECTCHHENIDHTGRRGECMRLIGIKPCLCERFVEKKKKKDEIPPSTVPEEYMTDGPWSVA